MDQFAASRPGIATPTIFILSGQPRRHAFGICRVDGAICVCHAALPEPERPSRATFEVAPTSTSCNVRAPGGRIALVAPSKTRPARIDPLQRESGRELPCAARVRGCGRAPRPPQARLSPLRRREGHRGPLRQQARSMAPRVASDQRAARSVRLLPAPVVKSLLAGRWDAARAGASGGKLQLLWLNPCNVRIGAAADRMSGPIHRHRDRSVHPCSSAFICG